MESFAIKQIVIALIFTIIIMSKFNQINTAIVNESITEANLSYGERDSYKRMFDGLQEGVIVCKDMNVTFMNELANKVLSHLTDHKNFFKLIKNDNSKSEIDRID
jgi:hypothetical protein